MRVEVDRHECQAYGNCVLVAPEVFELTETTPVVLVREERPAEALRGQVEDSALACPMQAIAVRD